MFQLKLELILSLNLFLMTSLALLSYHLKHRLLIFFPSINGFEPLNSTPSEIWTPQKGKVNFEFKCLFGKFNFRWLFPSCSNTKQRETNCFWVWKYSNSIRVCCDELFVLGNDLKIPYIWISLRTFSGMHCSFCSLFPSSFKNLRKKWDKFHHDSLN